VCRLLTAFVNVLPLATALRVWDIMLFERSPCVLFRVMLTIMDANTRAILDCHDALAMWTIVAKLPARCVDASELIDSAMLQYGDLDECGPADVLWYPARTVVEGELP
jgi:Rab-GTPase-TBC domain